MQGSFTQTINKAFVITNVVIYLYLGAACVLVFYAMKEDSDEVLWNRILLMVRSLSLCVSHCLSLCLICCCQMASSINMAFSLMFVFFGKRLFNRVSSLGEAKQSKRVQRMTEAAFKIVILTLAAAFCFLFRLCVNIARIVSARVRVCVSLSLVLHTRFLASQYTDEYVASVKNLFFPLYYFIPVCKCVSKRVCKCVCNVCVTVLCRISFRSAYN